MALERVFGDNEVMVYGRDVCLNLSHETIVSYKYTVYKITYHIYKLRKTYRTILKFAWTCESEKEREHVHADVLGGEEGVNGWIDVCEQSQHLIYISSKFTLLLSQNDIPIISFRTNPYHNPGSDSYVQFN
jgi:hypothetical protein